VTRWFRCSLSVAGPFVCRCLISSTMLPSSHPARRTGRADPHPALGESVTRSPPEATRPHDKADEAQHLIEEGLRKPPGSHPDHFVFGT
jgi:hypothetical protein